MHLEIQVALNFVISFMYNKLPRRRVNIFGEELERALRFKFQSHWYPDKPFKGSAFRCLRTGDPVDPVLDAAARESGLALAEIRENLPEDLCVWIDPGEVSYRIGEKGQVKVLYSEQAERHSEERCDREVTRTFNPEAQCFRPIDALSASVSSLSLSSPQSSASPFSAPPQVSPTPSSFKSVSPAPNFSQQRPSQALTFTTAAFAQTKFGSTKLKTSGKRGSRMSPTEFSNYIKQRALIQQQQQQPPPAPGAALFPQLLQQQQQQQQRALSPAPQLPPDTFPPFPGGQMGYTRGLYDPPAISDLFPLHQPPPPPPPMALHQQHQQRPPPPPPVGSSAHSLGAMFAALTPENQQLLESLSYANNPHLQHLLVAN